MSKQTITFKIHETPESKALVDFSVEADVKDGYGIHPSVAWDCFAGKMVLHSRLWTITHINSGCALGDQYDSFKQAAEWRAAVINEEINGVPFADLAVCEAVTCAPMVAASVARKLSTDPEAAYMRAVVNCKKTAETFCA